MRARPDRRQPFRHDARHLPQARSRAAPTRRPSAQPGGTQPYARAWTVPHFSTSASVDLIAISLTGLAVTLPMLVPLIPGLRDIPQLIPVHRLIWRQPALATSHPPAAVTPAQARSRSRRAEASQDGRGEEASA